MRSKPLGWSICNESTFCTAGSFSTINSVPKDWVDEWRVIVDLSWLVGSSINDGISKDTYLGEVINLHYASVEQICNMVMEIGPGALIYKRDLRHVYRQISVDPRDYCLCWGIT